MGRRDPYCRDIRDGHASAGGFFPIYLSFYILMLGPRRKKATIKSRFLSKMPLRLGWGPSLMGLTCINVLVSWIIFHSYFMRFILQEAHLPLSSLFSLCLFFFFSWALFFKICVAGSRVGKITGHVPELWFCAWRIKNMKEGSVRWCLWHSFIFLLIDPSTGNWRKGACQAFDWAVGEAAVKSQLPPSSQGETEKVI